MTEGPGPELLVTVAKPHHCGDQDSAQVGALVFGKLRCFVLFSAQITRKFRLNSEGKLEQTVSMATTTQPMTQHLHVTYKKVTL